MDLTEFLNYYQSFKRPSMVAKDLQNNNSIISLKQSKVSSINKKLLQVLSPSEETVKTCLYADQDKNNVNDNTDCDSSDTVNLNCRGSQFKNGHRFQSKRLELDFINTYDMASDSIYSDDLDQLVFKIISNNNLSLTTSDLNDYQNSETLYYQLYDDRQALQPNQHFTYNDYVKLRANTLLLARLGYKLTLTLNTDNDKPEAWNPNVAQTLLSVNYTPLGLVKDCFAARTPLDQFEPFLLEVIHAFRVDEPIELPGFAIKFRSDPSPAKFVSICKKLRGLKKLCDNDKIVLMSSSFYDVFSMNAVFKYNQSTDEWIFPEYRSRFGRRDFFLWNRLLHDATLLAIEALPDRWRKDEVVEALISLIVIFNPDQVGLIFADSVRQEQYVYIYLLKRYLESVCESACDASDNLYRLMVGVEKFRELGEITCKHMNEVVIGYHRFLINLIIDVIDNK